MKKWLKQLFCKHRYLYLSKNDRGTLEDRNSALLFECTKCGRIKVIN